MGWDVWGFSDWLINYQGGFVRRGLIGQWIFEHTHGAPAIGLVNEIVFGSFAALCVLLLCLIVLSRPLTWLAAFVMLLVPGGVYTAAMGNEYFYRKETLFHVYLASVAVCFLFGRRTKDVIASRVFDNLAILLIIVGSAILPFIHEGFLFISGVPTAIFVYWIMGRRSPRTGRAFALGYLAVLTSLFVVLAIFKGNAATANAVWASLNPTDQTWAGGSLDGAGGMNMLGASLWAGVRMALSVPLSGGAWN